MVPREEIENPLKRLATSPRPQIPNIFGFTLTSAVFGYFIFGSYHSWQTPYLRLRKILPPSAKLPVW